MSPRPKQNEILELWWHKTRKRERTMYFWEFPLIYTTRLMMSPCTKDVPVPKWTLVDMKSDISRKGAIGCHRQWCSLRHARKDIDVWKWAGASSPKGEWKQSHVKFLANLLLPIWLRIAHWPVSHWKWVGWQWHQVTYWKSKISAELDEHWWMSSNTVFWWIVVSTDRPMHDAWYLNHMQ